MSILKYFFFSFFVSFSFATNAQQYVSLKTNKLEYSEGEKIVLIARKVGSLSASDELFVQAEFAGEGSRTVQISEDLFASISNPLAGTSAVVKAYVYSQNKNLAQSKMASLAQCDVKILELTAALRDETEAGKIATIQAAILSLEATKSSLQNELQQSRTLLETPELTVSVTPLKRKVTRFFNSPVVVTPDKTGGVYQVGDVAAIMIEVIPDYITPQGNYDFDVYAKFDGNDIQVQKLGENLYQVYLGTDELILGNHALVANIVGLGKAESELLQNAIDRGLTRVQEFESLKESESGAIVAYYEKEIADINAIVSLIFDVYESLKTALHSENTPIVVEAAPFE